ncbi:hypothetical protein RZS08_36255, partial [Arthrospira platensis SPKY1]|nr:hypothetical protein [Arthrospira platensis SPKY1]
MYYGDESARNLIIEGTQGDATLRSFMNWEDIKNNPETQKLLAHYQKLGRFRANHPAIGAGKHQKIEGEIYTFSRVFVKGDYTDKVVVAIDAPKGSKTISVGSIFENGITLKDAYSG